MRKGEDAGGVRRENSIQEREKGNKEGGRGRDKETRKKEGESKDKGSVTVGHQRERQSARGVRSSIVDLHEWILVRFLTVSTQWSWMRRSKRRRRRRRRRRKLRPSIRAD